MASASITQSFRNEVAGDFWVFRLEADGVHTADPSCNCNNFPDTVEFQERVIIPPISTCHEGVEGSRVKSK